MCCGYQRKERCSWQRNAPTAMATSANAQTGVGRVATQQATAASKSWRIPQGSPSSLWEGVSKFHYPPRCHRARFAESGLRLRRSLGRLFRNHLLEATSWRRTLCRYHAGFVPASWSIQFSTFNERLRGECPFTYHLF